MFKVKRQPRVVSDGALVDARLSGNYKRKYAQIELLVKTLLANKFLLETVKQELKLSWGFVRENIIRLNSACKVPDIAL